MVSCLILLKSPRVNHDGVRQHVRPVQHRGHKIDVLQRFMQFLFEMLFGSIWMPLLEEFQGNACRRHTMDGRCLDQKAPKVSARVEHSYVAL